MVVVVQGVTFGFRSKTFEGIHQFLSKYAEGYSIIQYTSSSDLEVIFNIVTEVWHFFTKIMLSGQLHLKECINFIQSSEKGKASLNTGQV